MVNKLLDAASFLKSKIKGDELDDKLIEAVSEQNWQASTQLLHEIANASYNYQKQQRILHFIIDKLKHKSWRKILKTLHLVDFLLKYGPTSLILSFRENIYELRSLDNFTQESEGMDRGEPIRKQTKQIIDLLSDDLRLNEERLHAKKIKEKMANVIGTGAYYGSYSNQGGGGMHFGQNKKQGYQNYNSDSLKLPGNHLNGGLSFGEIVANSIKKDSDLSIQGSGKKKLNKTFENKESKFQQPKKNFNSLALKLVKPPEKKTSKKQQPPVVASFSKLKDKPDIMNFDTFNNNLITATNSNGFNDPFDFLGSMKAPIQLNTGHHSNNNQENNQDIPSFNFSTLPTQVRLIQKTSLSQDRVIHNQMQTQYPNAFSVDIFNNIQSKSKVLNPNPVVPKGISLNISAQPKLDTPTASSLIDLSNFREQLSISSNNYSHNTNPVQNWNW